LSGYSFTARTAAGVFQPIAFAAGFQDMAAMGQPVQHSAGQTLAWAK